MKSMTRIRIAFMGTPDFSVSALRVLHNAGHDIACVYCQPPKPAGRGRNERPSPVQIEAENLGLKVRTPLNFRDEDEKKFFADLNLDIAVVAAYGLLLPKAVLDAPKLGCINIHASLLPRWRGAAPIQRAMLAGDTETGITIMQMDAGLDTGAMLMKEKVSISDDTTSDMLQDKLSSLGADMILCALDGLANKTLVPVAQSEDGATYAAKLTRADGLIDWSQPADVIERQVRALNPWPGVSFICEYEQIKVLEAKIVADMSGAAGSLLDDKFTVACGKHALRLVTVQRAGKKSTDGASLLRGLRINIGHNFK